jgi:hypothetical protein
MMWAIEGTLERAMRILADHDDFERRAFLFEYRWSLWPRRCYRTGRRIWGRAVCVEAVWTGPGEPITERRWLHRDEGLLLMLKRNTANGHL